MGERRLILKHAYSFAPSNSSCLFTDALLAYLMSPFLLHFFGCQYVVTLSVGHPKWCRLHQSSVVMGRVTVPLKKPDQVCSLFALSSPLLSLVCSISDGCSCDVVWKSSLVWAFSSLARLLQEAVVQLVLARSGLSSV